MIDGPEPGRPLDLGRVAPDRLAVLEQDRLLAPDVLEPAADVVRVAVAGDELERHLLAATTDEERQALLDRRRVVADGLRRVARAGRRRLARRGASRA